MRKVEHDSTTPDDAGRRGLHGPGSGPPQRATRRRGPEAPIALGPPRDIVALQASLLKERLPKRLRAAARFLLDESDFVALNPLATVSARSGVTGSAYVRLAQALGYAGFGDLRQVLRDHLLLKSEGLMAGRGESRGNTAARLAPMAERVDRAMLRLLSAIDDAKLLHGAGLLADAGMIYIVGGRLALPAISFITMTLTRDGIRSVTVPSAVEDEDEAGSIGFAGPGDAAICVDFAPSSDETKRLVDILRRRHLPVLTLTDDVLGPVARSSTLSFAVGDAQAPDVPHLAAAMTLAALLSTLVRERRTLARRWPDTGSPTREP